MLSIVSDGTFEGAKILHNQDGRGPLDIKSGLTSCEILMEPGKPVRAVLIFDHVEVGMTVDTEAIKPPATAPALSGHRRLDGT